MRAIAKEKKKVLNWRYEQLREAGYDHISASLIANSGADLHKAEDLFGKTDSHTIVKILT